MTRKKIESHFLIIHHYFNSFLATIRRSPTLDLIMAEAYKKDLKLLENGFRLQLQGLPDLSDEWFVQMKTAVVEKFNDMRNELFVQIARVEPGGTLFAIRPARTTIEVQ